MQVQSFFRAKNSNQPKSFFSYKGTSKELANNSSKFANKKYQESDDYPMGEWNPSEQDDYPMGEWSPSGESSSIAASVLAALGKASIIDPNSSPTSADLCTTCFPMSEW